MRAVDPGAFIRELKGLPEVVKKQSKKMFVKICGITSAVDALQGTFFVIMILAVDSGADMIGLIFASASKRRVTTSSATEIVSALHAKYPRSGSQVCYIAPFDDGTNNEPTEWYNYSKNLT
jgi:anthranilate synthase/indole-3-glycerol phosphate synthase/phosphoribosylanthranilate isomerase